MFVWYYNEEKHIIGCGHGYLDSKSELIEAEDYAAITELTKIHLDKIEETTTVK